MKHGTRSVKDNRFISENETKSDKENLRFMSMLCDKTRQGSSNWISRYQN